MIRPVYCRGWRDPRFLEGIGAIRTSGGLIYGNGLIHIDVWGRCGRYRRRLISRHLPSASVSTVTQSEVDEARRRRQRGGGRRRRRSSSSSRRSGKMLTKKQQLDGAKSSEEEVEEQQELGKRNTILPVYTLDTPSQAPTQHLPSILKRISIHPSIHPSRRSIRNGSF